MKVDLNAPKGAFRLALQGSVSLGVMAMAFALGASPSLAQTASAQQNGAEAGIDPAATSIDDPNRGAINKP
jgi:hypothetical protein